MISIKMRYLQGAGRAISMKKLFSCEKLLPYYYNREIWEINNIILYTV